MTIPEAADMLAGQADEADDAVDAARLLDIATAVRNENFKAAKALVLTLHPDEQSNIDEDVWEWLMDGELQP